MNIWRSLLTKVNPQNSKHCENTKKNKLNTLSPVEEHKEMSDVNNLIKKYQEGRNMRPQRAHRLNTLPSRKHNIVTEETKKQTSNKNKKKTLINRIDVTASECCTKKLLDLHTQQKVNNTEHFILDTNDLQDLESLLRNIPAPVVLPYLRRRNTYITPFHRLLR